MSTSATTPAFTFDCFAPFTFTYPALSSFSAASSPLVGPSESSAPAPVESASESKASTFPLPFDPLEADIYEVKEDSILDRSKRLLRLHGGTGFAGGSISRNESVYSLHNIWLGYQYDYNILVARCEPNSYTLPFIDILLADGPCVMHARFVLDCVHPCNNEKFKKRFERSRLPPNWKDVHVSTVYELAYIFTRVMNMSVYGSSIKTITPFVVKVARALWQFFKTDGVVTEEEGQMLVLFDKVHYPDIGFLSALAIFMECLQKRDEHADKTNEWIDDCAIKIFSAVQLIRKLVWSRHSN